MRVPLKSTLLVSLNSKWITGCHYHHFNTTLLNKSLTTIQFTQLLSYTITTGLLSDPFISSKLLLLLSSSDLSFAFSLFFQIPNPNVFAWNFMLRAYSNSPSPQQSISLYNLMRTTLISPDKYTFPFVLKACSRVSFAKQKSEEIHAASLKFGFEFDVFVQNALISAYSAFGKVDAACRIFNLVPVWVRDVVSWNSLISGYLQMDLCREALMVFGNMWGENYVRPNGVTMVSALTACARIGELCLGKKIHGFILRNEIDLDVYLESSLIDLYVKCGRPDVAQKVFDRVPERNVVCWTSIIAGYVRAGLFKESISLFREMQMDGVEFDEVTVACVVSACGHFGALDLGRWVHAYCDRSGLEMNLAMKNALIDMYSKCGDIDKAIEIFNGLVQKDVFSWTVMISGLAMNGRSVQALDMFSQMEMSSGVSPNEVTFLGVLSACSHGGLVKEGYHYYNSMSNNYNIAPRIEHCGCMVDLLGRANLLAEAEKFVTSMPMVPDAVIWRSLLFSSQKYGNLEMAEVAAGKIMELEPGRSGIHVLLSNTYAAASRWTDVKKVRKGMDVGGIRKQPGCSFIEINGVVHEFFVADTFHSQTDKLYETIFRINSLLQFEGCSLDT
ncbi:hypothetical protein Scep_027759 [Stephania cephalantha]|uniref:Chlororespiratory reduction 4 n=1 Tax=Stephania cephalantha TaxID=152367 RepID=A0AAP0HL39_9MAGN